MAKPEPLRFTDAEVGDMMRAYREHGENSPEYQAALARCVQRLADWIDDKIAHEVYDSIYPSD